MGEKVIRLPYEDMPSFLRIANRYLGEGLEVKEEFKEGEEKNQEIMSEWDASKLRTVRNKVKRAWDRREHSSLPYESIYLTDEELDLMRQYMHMLGETGRLGPIDVKKFQ